MSQIMNSLLTQARKASRVSRDCRGTIDALQSMEFGEDSFTRLHHQSGSMAEFYRYSQSVQRFRDDKNNHRVHQRLKYVQLSCSLVPHRRGRVFRLWRKRRSS